MDDFTLTSDALRISIIGSAGRGEDLQKLDNSSFPRMVAETSRIAAKLAGDRPWAAVSGGAAWADHLAVVLFLEGIASALQLHLPCEFTASGFHDTGENGNASWRTNPGATLNRHHRNFAAKSGRDPFADIAKAMLLPRCWLLVTPRFFQRNSRVAEDVTDCIALTFGTGARVKDGGTHDTMGKFLNRKDTGQSVHVDLHTMRAFSPARLV